MIKPKSGFIKAELDSEKLTTRQWKGIMYAMDNYAEHYHQEKMKQHDALVKMMAQDEKDGNYEEKFYCVARNPYPNSAWNFDCDTQCKGCKNHSFPSK